MAAIPSSLQPERVEPAVQQLSHADDQQLLHVGSADQPQQPAGSRWQLINPPVCGSNTSNIIDNKSNNLDNTLDDVMDEKKIYTLFLLVILYELEIYIFVYNVNIYFVEINIIF